MPKKEKPWPCSCHTRRCKPWCRTFVLLCDLFNIDPEFKDPFKIEAFANLCELIIEEVRRNEGVLYLMQDEPDWRTTLRVLAVMELDLCYLTSNALSRRQYQIMDVFAKSLRHAWEQNQDVERSRVAQKKFLGTPSKGG